MRKDSPVLIAGGGIAGLSTAVQLADIGIRSIILEQAEHFLEIGAGLQLGPNAVKILQNLGLANHLEQYAVRPDGIKVFHAKTGQCLNVIPLKNTIEPLYNAAYYTLHRADLQAILLNLIQGNPNITIIPGFRIAHFSEQDNELITVISESGVEQEGQCLIGADGLWSHIRSEIYPNIKPKFSGKTAWRCLLPMDKAPKNFAENYVGLWLGANAHLVHYPVKSSRMLNVVAIIADKWAEQGWNKPGDAKNLYKHFSSWPSQVHELFEKILSWKKWALFDLPKLPKWSHGKVALIGDAAHPMMPFLAQGAAMAIEDAAVLAKSLTLAKRLYPEEAFQFYEQERKARCLRVQKTAHNLGKIYHYQGIKAAIRNLVIQNRAEKSLLKDYNWLYGYNLTN